MDRVPDILLALVLLAGTLQLARLWWQYLHPGPGIYTRWHTRRRLTLVSMILLALWVALVGVVLS